MIDALLEPDLHEETAPCDQCGMLCDIEASYISYYSEEVGFCSEPCAEEWDAGWEQEFREHV